MTATNKVISILLHHIRDGLVEFFNFLLPSLCNGNGGEIAFFHIILIKLKFEFLVENKFLYHFDIEIMVKLRYIVFFIKINK